MTEERSTRDLMATAIRESMWCGKDTPGELADAALSVLGAEWGVRYVGWTQRCTESVAWLAAPAGIPRRPVVIELARHDRSSWAREVVADHPPIPDVEPELRRHCMGLLDRSTDPIRWWPHDVVWGTVLDLHRKGSHDDAHKLAVFLMWCDGQGPDFMWELVTHESAPVEPVEKKTTVVDVELPFYEDGSATPNPPAQTPKENR